MILVLRKFVLRCVKKVKFKGSALFYSKKHNFIYLPTSKSASHAITKICIDIFEAKPMTPLDIGESCGIGCRFAAHSVFVPIELEGCYTFTSVRNPYTRELSKYNWMLRKKSPITRKSVFDEFNDLKFMSYIKWVCDNKRTDKWEHNVWKESQVDALFRQPVPNKCKQIVSIGKVLKSENLNSDFKTLPFVEKIHIPHIEKILSSKINSSKNQKNVIHEFPEKAQKLFCNRFEEDFIKFEYDVKNITLNSKGNNQC